jgi:hypothetical protein
MFSSLSAGRGTHQQSAQYVPNHSRGQEEQGVTLTTQPHLASRLKKGYSYTSTPPLDLHGLSKGAICRHKSFDISELAGQTKHFRTF